MNKKNVMSFMLMVSIGLAPGMQANAASFTDMPSDWSTTALEKAVKNNLLQGFENQIMPKKNLTRAEMATVVSKMLGLTEQGNLSGFTDVSSDKWYYGAMQRTYGAGIITGDGHGKLNPESNITREETAVILSRILMLTSNSDSSGKFADSTNVSAWAKTGLNALIDKGYMQGSESGLNPKQNITRAEFAKLLDNISESYIREMSNTVAIKMNGIVNSSNVSMIKGNIGRDLVLAEGTGNATITLDGVDVGERIVVRGGRKLILKNKSDMKEIVIAEHVKSFEIVVEDEKDMDRIKSKITSGANKVTITDGSKDKTTPVKPDENKGTGKDKDKGGSGGGGGGGGGGNTDNGGDNGGNKQVNYANLNKALERAEKYLSIVKTDKKNALENAKKAAKVVKDNTKSTQSQVDSATSALNSAIELAKYSQSEIDKLLNVDYIEKLDFQNLEKFYTVASFDKFSDAIAQLSLINESKPNSDDVQFKYKETFDLMASLKKEPLKTTELAKFIGKGITQVEFDEFVNKHETTQRMVDNKVYELRHAARIPKTLPKIGLLSKKMDDTLHFTLMGPEAKKVYGSAISKQDSKGNQIFDIVFKNLDSNGEQVHSYPIEYLQLEEWDAVEDDKEGTRTKNLIKANQEHTVFLESLDVRIVQYIDNGDGTEKAVGRDFLKLKMDTIALDQRDPVFNYIMYGLFAKFTNAEIGNINMIDEKTDEMIIEIRVPGEAGYVAPAERNKANLNRGL